MAFFWFENHNDDLVQVEEIIARVEELREACDLFVVDFDAYRVAKGSEAEAGEGAAKWAEENPDDARELAVLVEFLGELCGCGGDHQWDGDWYPQTLIQNTYFETYARDLAEDIYGDQLREAKWPFDCIDWEKAANELEQDYSCVNLEIPDDSGQVITFLYR